MKLILVSATIKNDNGVHTDSKWVGSQAEAVKARKEFTEKGAKRNDMVTLDVEVPTNKAGLLEFLNEGKHK